MCCVQESFQKLMAVQERLTDTVDLVAPGRVGLDGLSFLPCLSIIRSFCLAFLNHQNLFTET